MNNKTNTNKTVRRGRPEISLSFNFGKGRPFTIDNVLTRANRNGYRVSRPGVYAKLQKLIAAGKARVKDHNGPVVVGQRSHPVYRYELVG